MRRDILVVDGDSTSTFMLRKLLSRIPDCLLVGEAADGRETVYNNVSKCVLTISLNTAYRTL